MLLASHTAELHAARSIIARLLPAASSRLKRIQGETFADALKYLGRIDCKIQTAQHEKWDEY